LDHAKTWKLGGQGMVLHEASQFTNGVRFSKSRLRRSFRSDDLSADRLAPGRPRNFPCCRAPRRSSINKISRKSGSTGLTST